jgi:hypothetical protein
MTHDACVVRKSGFFATLVKSVFGTICVVLVCVTSLGLYAINVFDRQASMVIPPTLETARDLLGNWQTNLPPALADAVADRRDPDYRSRLQVEADIVGQNTDAPAIVVELKNAGDRTVSTVAARIVARDRRGTPVYTRNLYLATPITLPDNDWPGPLLPASDRTVMRHIWNPDTEIAKVDVEISDVRVWDPQIAATGPALARP